MRKATLLAALFLALPAVVQAKDTDAPLVVIGQSFGPDSPMPVSPGHPLYHRVALAAIDGAPDHLTPGVMLLGGGTKREEAQEGLRTTLERMNLLAPSDAEARVRLTPRWGDLHAPATIGFSSHASATLHYTLTRLDSGMPLFDREIVTETDARGGDGAARLIGNARTALAVNFASAAACIDKAAIGRAPSDCALTPNFAYKAPAVHAMIFMPAFH